MANVSRKANGDEDVCFPYQRRITTQPLPFPLPQTFLYHRRTTKAGPSDFNAAAEGLMARLDRRPLPLPLPHNLPPLPLLLPPVLEGGGAPRGGAATKGKLPRLGADKGAAVVLIEVGWGRVTSNKGGA